jgi:hypothetical protein
VSDDVRVLNWFLGACCIILGAGLGAIDVASVRICYAAVATTRQLVLAV